MGNDWHSLSWGDTLADDIELLLRDLCVGWGYCNRSVFAEDLLRDGVGVVTSQAVARATLLAEGAADPWISRAIERLFVYRYGAPSITETDFPPSSSPYSVPPKPRECGLEPPDPVLVAARSVLCRLPHETPRNPAEARPFLEPVAPEDIRRSIKRARRIKAFAVGPEEEKAAHCDLRALIVFYELLTGEYWNSDPESRRRLGLGPSPGTSGEDCPPPERQDTLR